MDLPNPVRKGPPIVPIVGACCGGCLLLVVLVAMLGVWGFRGASKSYHEADAVGRRFLGYVGANEIDQAWGMAASAWKKQSSLEDFKSFVGYWRQQQGTFGTIKLSNWSFFSDTSGTRVTLVYDVAGSRQNGRVTIVLVPESGGYRVLSCNFTPMSSSRDGTT